MKPMEECEPFAIKSVTFEEITHAQQSCRKRKAKTTGCMEYDLFELEQDWDLYVELDTQTYEIRASDAFIVEYPCPREVFAGQYRDRVVHHLIIDRHEQTFENIFIDSSYSCRKGRGTLYGVRDAYDQLYKATKGFTRQVYIVKGDFTSCFMRVDKDLLMRMIEEEITQDPFELWLFRMIVYNKPQDYCRLKTVPDRWLSFPRRKSLFGTDGMPIGNLTSQILVNFYLHHFDNWALRYKLLGYGRYVDDFFAYFETLEEALAFIDAAQVQLAPFNMEIHPKKIEIIPSDRGFEFIGSYIKPFRIYTTKRTISKFSQVLYENAFYDVKLWYGTINSYLGYLGKTSSYGIRYRIINHFEYLHKWGYFNDDLTKFIPYKNYQHKVGCKSSKYERSNYIMLMDHYSWNQRTTKRMLGLQKVA